MIHFTYVKVTAVRAFFPPPFCWSWVPSDSFATDNYISHPFAAAMLAYGIEFLLFRLTSTSTKLISTSEASRPHHLIDLPANTAKVVFYGRVCQSNKV
jgi:hypothetical protein